MIDLKKLKKINNVCSKNDDISNYLNILFDYTEWYKFNYEKDSVDTLISFIEDFAEYFYHYNGILNDALSSVDYKIDDLKKIVLIKNMKMILESFIADIKKVKENKERFALICHAKNRKTILTLVLNLPLKIDKKLYVETPLDLTYNIFDVEDPYSLRFANDVLATIKGKGPKDIERRIRIVNTRKLLKEYADKNKINTAGVFALLPRGT